MPAGEYTVTVSYVGFSVLSQRLFVKAGQPVQMNAVLQVGTHNEAVTVRADREGGEAKPSTSNARQTISCRYCLPM